MNRITAFLSKESVILLLYLLGSPALGIPHYLRGLRGINNFTIFKQSFPHLVEARNLYLNYPAEYADVFLYHPTFAILFAPFSLVPNLPSLLLWLWFCGGAMFFGIKSLPVSQKQKIFLWLFSLLVLINALNGQQTNPLLVACGLFTFSFLEKNDVKWAALFPVLGFCIKGYGIIFAVLFLFYPQKKQFFIYSALWLIIFTFLPLLVITPGQLVQVYQEWIISLNEDHMVNYGFSIMGLFKLWEPNLTFKGLINIQISGLILLAVTLLRNLQMPETTVKRRMLMLSYLFLWVVLFNHASESQTYIIAIIGVALYYINNRSASPALTNLLVCLVFVFSMLTPLDIFPKGLQNFQDLLSKNLAEVIPCLAVWILCQTQLLFKENEKLSPAHYGMTITTDPKGKEFSN